LDSQNIDCFEKITDFHWDRNEEPEPVIYRDDKIKTLPYNKGLSMNEEMKRKK
jgi:hypothetical protein